MAERLMGGEEEESRESAAQLEVHIYSSWKAFRVLPECPSSQYARWMICLEQLLLPSKGADGEGKGMQAMIFQLATIVVIRHPAASL